VTYEPASARGDGHVPFEISAFTVPLTSFERQIAAPARYALTVLESADQVIEPA
jgi:hypothetical protein